ncbi:MAG: hypothetical protein ABI780_00100 [Ardenticatenales bacterium]
MGEARSSQVRPSGGATRHPWYDDRLGRSMRTGLAEVRAAQPSDDVWKAIAAELGLPADAAAAAGLPQTSPSWLVRLAQLFGHGRTDRTVLLARLASVGAMAAAVFVVGLSLDVVLSGKAASGLGWTTAGLHQIGVPIDEAAIQPSPQNRAPADMSAAQTWPRTGGTAGAGSAASGHTSPLALVPGFGRSPARVVVPR